MKTHDLISDESGRNAPSEPHVTPGASLARFWELRGFPVLESGGVFWRRFKGPVYSPISAHLRLDPEKGEIEEVMRHSRLLGVRFATCGPGIDAGLYVVRPASYSLASVNRKQRAYVVRGLNRCEFRQVEEDELIETGIPLNCDTMKRQGRHDPELAEPARWKHYVRSAFSCPGFSVAGIYINGRLSAYMVCYRDGSWLHLLCKMSRSEELAHGTNHALDFAVLRKAGEDASILAVANGITPLNNPGLDRYKRGMGYEVVPHPLAIQFHPAVRSLIANRATLAAAGLLHWAVPRPSLHTLVIVLEAAVAIRSGSRQEPVSRQLAAACGPFHGSEVLPER